MTLTRAPCELDKMSLFQDLKLKRRKVDSRCSSDGESVADTSTSSPDLPGMEALGGAQPASPDSPQDTAGPPVFDGGGGHSEQAGVIRQTPRSRSPPPQQQAPPPELPPRPHSSPSRQMDMPVQVPIRLQQPQFQHQEIQAHIHLHTQHQQLMHSPPPRISPHPPTSVQQTSPALRTSPPSPLSIPHSTPLRNTPGVITSQAVSSGSWLGTANIATTVASGRINGVKPELIGGNFTPTLSLHTHTEMKPPVLSPQPRPGQATQIRQPPTVIMGEAGGVRTMIWSQPAVTNPQTSPLESLHASTSWSSGSSNSSPSVTITSTPSDESAAALLLNLGQHGQEGATRLRLAGHMGPSAGRSGPAGPQQATLNMERLWAGDLTQLPANQQLQALNLSQQQAAAAAAAATAQQLMYLGRPIEPLTMPSEPLTADSQQVEDEEQPMICMICEDKATGLHYGIITCEGCKGFFKRTVQNRRVYTCVADGCCEITKAQRNRCQYCRFKKCIEQGMVLQAVREDRMPGGRNSGAVYNLYKVKYKKHKKTTKQTPKQQTDKVLLSPPQVKSEPSQGQVPPHLVNGTILKTALTNPSEVVHLRQRLDNAVSSSRDRTSYSIENNMQMIQALIECDEFQDIATLQNLDELLDHKSDLSEKLCQIGDSIVYKLVQWTKRLPFYLELPVEVHTRLLTHKWHELLVLTTSAYQAIHGNSVKQGQWTNTSQDIEVDFTQEVSANLMTLQSCLTSMMGRAITMDQLRQDVGLMVEKITHVTLMFRRIKLTMEEYVCLKVITMLNQARPGGNTAGNGGGELEAIQDRYMSCLRAYTQHMCPQQPTRFHELLVRLPEVQSAAALLLESKMFYVPFLLNSAIQR